MGNSIWMEEWAPIKNALHAQHAGGAGFVSRLLFVSLCLAVALILPLSKTAAQGSAPVGAGEVHNIGVLRIHRDGADGGNSVRKQRILGDYRELRPSGAAIGALVRPGGGGNIDRRSGLYPGYPGKQQQGHKGYCSSIYRHLECLAANAGPLL